MSLRTILGPVLFVIYITDIVLGLNNLITKFVGDTKNENAALTEQGSGDQEDLHKISDWSGKWEILFKVTLLEFHGRIACSMFRLVHGCNEKYKMII